MTRESLVVHRRFLAVAYDDETRRDGRFRTEGGSVARAKQTARSEARRRYRQAAAQPLDEAGTDLDIEERRPSGGPGKASPRAGDRPAQTPAGRPSFMSAFRSAYHAPHVREDLAALPMLLRSRALLGAMGVVLIGAVAWYAFPNLEGSIYARDLLVIPGSALVPQLIAGFFAPRASYLLGLIVGLVQGIVVLVLVTQFGSRLGTPLGTDQVGSLLTLAFVQGPISSMLFSAAAAWYRRFLALSGPRRAASRGSSGRPAAKGNASRRPASR
jgi:hypothetical protein